MPPPPTDATLPLLLDQVIVRPVSTAPAASFAVAWKLVLNPIVDAALDGVTTTEATGLLDGDASTPARTGAGAV